MSSLTKDMTSQVGVVSQLNTKFKQQAYWQGNLRERTIGLRREVSKMRNDLLLLSFSLGVVKTSVIDAIADSEKYKNSLLGLSSIARSTGNVFTKVKQQAQDLTKDGLLNLADASASLKNLMASKFNLHYERSWVSNARPSRRNKGCSGASGPIKRAYERGLVIHGGCCKSG